MQDNHFNAVTIVFIAISFTIMVAMFVTCIWSDHDRLLSPLKHPVNIHHNNTFHVEKI